MPLATDTLNPQPQPEPLTVDKLATFEMLETIQASRELLQLSDVLVQQVRGGGRRDWVRALSPKILNALILDCVFSHYQARPDEGEELLFSALER